MAAQENPLQTLYRLSVMTGTLAVCAMAAYRYGPPPDRLADLIDGVAARMHELARPGEAAEELSEAPLAGVPQPLEFPDLGAAGWAPMAPASGSRVADAPHNDPLVAPAMAPLEASGSDPEAALRAAGATEASVTPWGTSGLAYRAYAEFPVEHPGGALGVQQVDALGETPEEAARRALDLARSSAANRGDSTRATR